MAAGAALGVALGAAPVPSPAPPTAVGLSTCSNSSLEISLIGEGSISTSISDLTGITVGNPRPPSAFGTAVVAMVPSEVTLMHSCIFPSRMSL